VRRPFHTVVVLVKALFPVNGGSSADIEMGIYRVIHGGKSLVLGGVIGHMEATILIGVFHNGETPAERACGYGISRHDKILL
jgi:hypothetical protein